MDLIGKKVEHIGEDSFRAGQVGEIVKVTDTGDEWYFLVHYAETSEGDTSFMHDAAVMFRTVED